MTQNSFAQGTVYATSGMGKGGAGTARLQAQLAVEKAERESYQACANQGLLYGPAFAGTKNGQNCISALFIDSGTDQVNISDNIAVGGAAAVTGGLTVGGAATISTNLGVTGDATIGGNFSVGGGIQIGDLTTCDGAAEGTIRYNATDKTIDLCDGTAWAAIGGGAGGGGQGYFVVTESEWNGNLGGLGGANNKCLTELQNKSWLGKSEATLSASNVKAFLCDSTTCQLPLGNTTYSFAAAGNTVGGAIFMTDGAGRGPNDSNTWNGNAYFGNSFFYWTCHEGGDIYAAKWPGTPHTSLSNCADWTSTSSGSGVTGHSNNNKDGRWASSYGSCANSNRLICIVNP